MELSRWKEKGKYISYRGNRIFCISQGTGPTLLLLHGFPTASFDWHLMHDDLCSKYRVVCFDMIGYGFSDKPRDYKYSISDQADLTEFLLEELGITSCDIFAHDKGDTVANELIARQNEGKNKFKILSCCFLNGGLFPGIHKPRPVQWLLMTPMGKYLSAWYQKWMLTKTFRKIFGPNTQPSASDMNIFWELLNINDGRKVFHKLIYYMQDRIDNEERWLKALQQSKIPLRLIDGAFDPISGKHMGLHYEKVIPNPDVVYLDSIGHYPQIEAPKEVLRHYFEFREVLNID